MATTVLLLGFVLAAAITDFRWHKIYNWTTLPGIVTGVLVNAIDSDAAGLDDSLLGLLGCGLIMVFCFLSFEIGAGDVKLIAMIGAFLGWYHGLECMLWTFVLGAALGVSLAIWRFGAIRIVTRCLQQLWGLIRHQTWLPFSDADVQLLKTRLYLAPAALAAVVIQRFDLMR